MRPKEPLLNIEEPAPVYLAVIFMLVHLGLLLAPVPFRDFVFSALALAAYQGDVFMDGRPVGTFPTLLTHTLLHAGWGHVFVNSGLMLAFGVISIRGVRDRFRPVLGRLRRGSMVFLLIFLAGALAGGLGQWLVWTLAGSTGAAIGASTGGAAMFAAAAWALGGSSRVLAFGIVLVAYDAFTIFMGSQGLSMSNPAWAGHLGGFLAGAILGPVFIKPSSVGFGRRG